MKKENLLEGVRLGMPMHSVKTVLVYHNGMRLTEVIRLGAPYGCEAVFEKGGNTVGVYYLDGIVYRFFYNGKEVANE